MSIVVNDGPEGPVTPWEVLKAGTPAHEADCKCAGCRAKRAMDVAMSLVDKAKFPPGHKGDCGCGGCEGARDAVEKMNPHHGADGRFASGKGGGATGGGSGGAPTYQNVSGGGRISRADAAAQMFGTGSKQHKQAIEMDRKANAKKK